MVKEDEDEELLSDWEKGVSKKLEKLDAMEQDIQEIKKLVAKREVKPAKEKKPKPAKKTVKELIAKSTPFLGDFNVARFIELAQAEGLVGNESYSDEDIAVLNEALPSDFLIDELAREDAIKQLSEKLGIDPSRFEAIAEEEIILPADEAWYEEEEPEQAEEPLPSEIKVIEKTVPVPEEEAEEEE